MLALETGWTPDVLAELPAAFRGACHWALYVHAIVGDEGLTETETPVGASMAERLELMKAKSEQAKLRTVLYPDDNG